MLHWHGLPAAGLSVLVLAAILALIAPVAAAPLAAGDAIYYVDAGAAGAVHDGSSWATAYTDLQSALAAASSGQIWVAEGTYKPALAVGGTGTRYQSFQLENGVALYGGFDPTDGDITFGDRDWKANPTILSGDLSGNDGSNFANNGENSYHVIYGGASLNGTAILDGFTIAGGNANGSGTEAFGGGMVNYGSPGLVNCTFSGNHATNGGGMVNYGSPTLTDCTFAGNSTGNAAGTYGGGMANYSGSSPKLIRCTFSGNSAYDGGGIFNYGATPTLTGCTFSGNSAEGGAGMSNFYGSSPVLTNCTFSGNSAGTCGGGIDNYADCSPVLTNCIFTGNSAGEYGGGMSSSENSSPKLTNCTFSGNSATAGGGMANYSGSSPVLTNCILWGSSQGQIFNYSAAPVITYSDIWGGSGSTNIDADPLFVDADGSDGLAGTADDNLRLAAGSPAIDAGSNSSLPADTADLDQDGNTTEQVPFDLDGSPRIVDSTVDMGAHEYQIPSPTSTPTSTSTPTTTNTSTPTATNTSTSTATPTATNTSTPTATPTATSTSTPTAANTGIYLPLVMR